MFVTVVDPVGFDLVDSARPTGNQSWSLTRL
jgi:hypothetical protein